MFYPVAFSLFSSFRFLSPSSISAVTSLLVIFKAAGKPNDHAFNCSFDTYDFALDVDQEIDKFSHNGRVSYFWSGVKYSIMNNRNAVLS